mmetsp:Transcript_312/g.1016  ORF Transcript_312/g.1016 Transcript_312/m.1016 type:complete len:154 (+) Transcript_312:413-874(+)
MFCCLEIACSRALVKEPPEPPESPEPPGPSPARFTPCAWGRQVLTSLAFVHLDAGSRRSQRRIISEFLSSATQATIDRLPVYIFGDKEEKEKVDGDEEEGKSAWRVECSICLEDANTGEKIRILPCMHQFHAKCVDQWLLNNAMCPTCKFSIL